MQGTVVELVALRMERWWDSRDDQAAAPHEEIVEQYRIVCLGVLAEVEEERRKRRRIRREESVA